jgi:glycosyltransferase involved in cell wall biosynthesis
MKKYLVLSNDKIFLKNKKVSSDFNDVINIIESIGKKYEIFLLSRNSKKKLPFLGKIFNKITRINYSSISLLKKYKQIRIFVISITWRNFINFLIIKFFKGKISGYVYLRSDGSKEYQKKIGYIGIVFYKFMLNFFENNLKIISVSKQIYNAEKKLIVKPSELDQDWFSNQKKISIDKPKVLYLGRIKVEKGVYSLLKLFSDIKKDYKLSIVGGSHNFKKTSKISFFKQVSKKKELIKLYNNHNIFILPSYTEGAPKVILESLSRLRPVIVFNEIKHVKSNLRGIFICDRRSYDLKKKINYILLNYKKIQKEMKKNNLTTKKSFQKKLLKILDASYTK